MKDTNLQINTSGRSPKTKEQWVEEGISYYKAHRYQEALIACEYAIQLNPTYARAHHGKGLILSKMKEYKEAREAYKQAWKFAPDNAKIYLDMGELLYI